MRNSSEKKKFDFSKIDIDTIVTFCKNNTRYISAGVLTLILAVALAVTAANGGKVSGKKDEAGQTQAKQEQSANQQQDQKQKAEPASGEYAVNEVPAVNDLVKQYYIAYASGDIDTLAKLADPISDMEKSYVQLMGQQVESYSNLTCYTKSGLEDNSYLVSVTFDMKFNGADGTLPGLELLYVRTREGSLYIDNAYSNFNDKMKELERDPAVDALLEKFQDQDDVKKLKNDFQNKYTEVIAANENLQNQVNTVSTAIENWAASYRQQVAQQEAAAQQAAAEQAAQQAAAEQAAAEQAAQQAAAEQAAQQAAAEQAAAEQAAQQAAAEQAAQQQGDHGGINYVPDNTMMTATDAYNMRSSMSETSERIATIGPGEKFKAVLSYAEGWTKVEWNGKTGFVRTDLLLNN